jgi:LuxR family transcriptional regulator, maltose regulon positive regulatory protein
MEVNENSASVRIDALGTFEITAGWILPGRRRIRASKVRELLMGLIAAGARGLQASVLCEALWPESHASEALRALIVTIYRLRRALRCYGAVVFEGGRVALNPTRCWVDAWAFEQAVVNPLAAGDEIPECELLNALARYRGALFGGACSPLALNARDRLRRLFVSGCLAAGRRLLRSGDAAGAIELYERAIGVEEACEDLYRALILAQSGSGRAHTASESYQRCRQSLMHRFGTAPSRVTARALNETCNPHAGSGERREVIAACSATP